MRVYLVQANANPKSMHALQYFMLLLMLVFFFLVSNSVVCHMLQKTHVRLLQQHYS